MEVIHHVNKSENKTQCFKRNNRISAGYSPFTNREMKHEIKNIMDSPNDYKGNINKYKAILTMNNLSALTSDESELIRFSHSKAVGRRRKEKYFNSYNVAPAYDNYNPACQKVFCKQKNNCRTACGYEYTADEKVYQHAHRKNNKTVDKIPLEIKLQEANQELNEYCGISKNSKLQSFLVGSKKYLTLCVSKECLVERNILKCVKYIISNAQCKFFKFKEYSNSEKNDSITKPKKTNNILRNSLLKNDTERKKSFGYTPENNKTYFSDNSYLTRLRNSLNDNIRLENVSNILRNMIGKSIYIQMYVSKFCNLFVAKYTIINVCRSLILAVGTIFFWKLYQIIFACQCKKVGYSTQLISQISNYRKNACSLYVYTFVGCFIMYQLLKDFINLFYEPY